MTTSSPSFGTILRIIHEATEFSRPTIGSPMTALKPADQRMPDLSLAGVEARSARASELLERLDRVDLDSVPHEIGLTLRLIRYYLDRVSGDAGRYWLAVDGLGIGYYGMFAWTAYNCGFLTNLIASHAQGFNFEKASDADRYLGFISDIAVLIEQLDTRTRGQADRGIVMPRAQLEKAFPLLEGLRTMLGERLRVVPDRLAGIDAPGFPEELGRRIEILTGPVFAHAIETLETTSQGKAPEAVGLDQYPGGREVYDDLVRFHTTLDLSPEQIHDLGVDLMKRMRAEMAEIRAEAGFAGDDQAYLKSLREDPLWRAETAEGVSEFFQRYIDRMKPVYDEYFDFECPVPYGVRALPDSLESGMTFGFYDMPRPDKLRGDYLFNAANLTQTQLSNVAALTYHELVPGHHLHISTQQQIENVHPLHNDAFFNAFNEGWGEYAATLAGEAGMYREPAERFGLLVMRAFLNCRLVVDTGMNALGWTLEDARTYLRENSFLSEVEIESETIRYSCDIPGQSLAYKLGDAEILRLREETRARLGDAFDIRAFHRAVLQHGGMPLPLLAWNIQQIFAD
ncbi:DUF885 family protein [Agromyces sp. NPDC056379]|uniref:DUF885 domain-containing protein n=1 Tax=unclassified Agromyces TaxID=2639701 RepID=UPI0035DAF2C7